MKIIIVGPDSAGKSTLVEELKGNKLFKKYDFEKGLYETVGKNPLKSVDIIREDERKNVIYDRWPIIDDFVYSKIIDGKDSVLSKEIHVEHIKEVLDNIRVVYVSASLDELQERLTTRGDEYINLSQLNDIMAEYEKVFKLLKIEPIRIDTTFTVEGYAHELLIDKLKQIPQWMGLAHIVPTSGLKYIENDPFQMTLAHLFDDEEYFNHYKNELAKGNFVIMDNGAFEGADLSNEEIYELYLRLKPTEVVLKDILLGGDESFEVTKESYEFFKDKNIDAKLMAVPQGNTIDEWKANALKIIDLGVDTIGIPRVVARLYEGARLDAAKFVRDNDLDIEIHLLGAAEDFKETKNVLDKVNIRSMDTSLAFMINKEGLEISLESKRPNKSIDFNEPFTNEIGFINHKKFMDKKIIEKE